ncbi:sugar phosphate isomerase/epimerase [Halobacillus fulvus]|nr:sugar phosphate isomerase/epimerase [Halobacillus fulvus]
MPHRLAMSGSTIMSDASQFHKLFNKECSHVEIGEFEDMKSFEEFLEQREKHQVTYGVHSPLIRGESKYDLLEEVQYPVEEARRQLVREAAILSERGAEYLLVHFPFFLNEATDSSRSQIEEGLHFLKELQDQYQLPIVCEPKLGKNRSSYGIERLHAFPNNLLKKYDVSICIDIGDYRMATKEEWKTYVEPLLPFTKVIHLHNVVLGEEYYYWSPIHPDFDHYDMKPMIELLSSGGRKYFVLEHTPHTNPSARQISEGVHWVSQLIT